VASCRTVLRSAGGVLSLLGAVGIGAGEAHAQKVEGRALWVTRFDYDSEAKIARIMETAAKSNFNIVYFQVRASGDAYYKSDIEPCAARLCGKLGGTASWDPLAVAVREGHRHGLEVHAYLNALTARPAGIEGQCKPMPEPDAGNPRHILLEHPEWVMADRRGKRLPCPNGEEYIWLSPSFPGVRTQLARVAADVARRYDVDGIHLDRIRYPGNAWSWDSASRAEFGKNPDQNPLEWRAYRTSLVNRMVRETYDSISAVKPHLVYSAAVWGIYDDKWNWKTLAGRADLMQDSRAWAKDGYMDILVPMTYSRIKTPCARIDWGCMLDEQLQGAEKETGRQMYIGIDASKGAREVVSQVRMARERGATGMALFSYSALADTRAFQLLASTVFSEPASVPAMPWKTQATH
jgi:uncharacterized lipoprotein YddW (UPF0748 family)